MMVSRNRETKVCLWEKQMGSVLWQVLLKEEGREER